MPMPDHARADTSSEPTGLAARRIAADILDNVLRRHRPLDDQLECPGAHPSLASLTERNRALAHVLIATVLLLLRTLAQLIVLFLCLEAPSNASRVEAALGLVAALFA